MTDRLRTAAARAAAHTRWNGPDHDHTLEARRDLRAEQLERYLRRELATWPPLTERTRDHLATLLLATPPAHPDAEQVHEP